MLRSQSVWFFTSANPSITFGGFEGEPKDEMFTALPKEYYPNTIYIKPGEDFNGLLEKIKSAGLLFPFAVKPNIGNSGLLFRKIRSVEQLQEYHALLDVDYMVQAFVNYPVELGIYYYRMPGEAKGTITGFLQKIPMFVTGNGKYTLEELVLQIPNGKKRVEDIRKHHEAFWHKVIPSGQNYQLSDAANRTQGGQFRDLSHEIDEALYQIVDGLSHAAGGWYFGRWDIMCSSVADFKQGKKFAVLEFNGVGAAPNHIYQNGYTLRAAYGEVLKCWKAMYAISRANRQKGVEPWPAMQGWRFLQQALRHLEHIRAKDNQLSF
jgi:hypothetical protein